MKLLSVVGPAASEVDDVAERVMHQLADRGRVGIVRQSADGDAAATANLGAERYRSAGAGRVTTVADDGWVAVGDDESVGRVLEELARSCAYGVVTGRAIPRHPVVVLGDLEVDRGDVIARETTADAVDLEGVLEALETSNGFETLQSLVDQVKSSENADLAGAIATFTGRVRERDHPDDDPTHYLEFEKYEGVAETTMASIREALEAREGVYDVRLHHRTGIVDAGEDIVFVVVLAGHRQEAFRAVEDGINRLKDEVPLFKKEVTVSEEFWAHE